MDSVYGYTGDAGGKGQKIRGLIIRFNSTDPNAVTFKAWDSLGNLIPNNSREIDTYRSGNTHIIRIRSFSVLKIIPKKPIKVDLVIDSWVLNTVFSITLWTSGTITTLLLIYTCY